MTSFAACGSEQEPRDHMNAEPVILLGEAVRNCNGAALINASMEAVTPFYAKLYDEARDVLSCHDHGANPPQYPLALHS
jgi:hypothetical protein